MYLLAIYVLAVGVWTVAADFGVPHHPMWRVNNVLVGDKVVHFAVVGLFALVIARAIWQRGFKPLHSLAWAMGLAALAATLEEFSNELTVGRHYSGLDLVADYAGILVLGALGWWLEFRSLPHPYQPRPLGSAMHPATPSLTLHTDRV